jgi:S1-C subfamily serine protease
MTERHEGVPGPFDPESPNPAPPQVAEWDRGGSGDPAEIDAPEFGRPTFETQAAAPGFGGPAFETQAAVPDLAARPDFAPRHAAGGQGEYEQPTAGSGLDRVGESRPAHAADYPPSGPTYQPAAPAYQPAAPYQQPVVPSQQPAPGYRPAASQAVAPSYQPASPAEPAAAPGYEPGGHQPASASGYQPAAPAEPGVARGFTPPGGGFGQPPVSAPPNFQPVSAPPNFQPVSAPPTYGPVSPAPFSETAALPPQAAVGPARPAGKSGGRALGRITVSLTLVLLVVVIVQSVFLVKLSDRADRQEAELRASNARMEKTQSDLDATSKRIAGVDDRTKGSLNSAAVARQVLPSVFRVQAGNATGTAFAFGKPATGTGTLLVTNYHVVESVIKAGGRDAALVRGKDRHAAKIVKFDERRDLAVLQVGTVYPLLTAASAAVQPGEPVVVVGAPLGLADTVTTGVVSAIRSDVPGLNSRVIQFDAAISPGNSGGPVSNAEGHVVGVAQAKIIRDDADGLALAIPISEVCDGLVDC